MSRLHNPILRGWLAYYGRFYRSAMYPVFRHFNKTLVAWAMRKYRRPAMAASHQSPTVRAGQILRLSRETSARRWGGPAASHLQACSAVVRGNFRSI
ncbi:MAG: group II intron maturase-specific domain-containing protein [Accumulibacter sp.]|uniref:group II intron maturase-specific domain-containing protein n=1 Tax=Accumulibacter sp. TaxID=2053492 RepID=UPI002FC34D5B